MDLSQKQIQKIAVIGNEVAGRMGVGEAAAALGQDNTAAIGTGGGRSKSAYGSVRSPDRR